VGFKPTPPMSNNSLVPPPGLGPDGLVDGNAYLTVDQLAKWWQVHPVTVRKLMKSDPSLPVTKLGRGSVRFRVSSLERWLREREGGRATPRTRRPLRVLPNVAPDKDAANE
jgi:Helix-turn-helix domain